MKAIKLENTVYMEGKDDVVKITLTDQGTSKLNMYRILYKDGSYLYIGKLKDPA